MVENQEVEDPPSMKFTWRIENFSGLNTKKKYSEMFVVGDSKWRLLICPKGNKTKTGKTVDHLSIYLDVADSATLPYGWSRYVQFSLTVVSQVHSKYSIRRDTRHQFNARESNWGFTKFMPLSYLYDPSSGYLVNDTCIIEAKVAVRMKFKWRIENFTKLNTKYLYSEIFDVGDYKWRILIFPKGNNAKENNLDHLSIYLVVADLATLPLGWSRYAQFSLTVVNQLNSNNSVRKDAEHQFTANGNDRGFTSFMPLSDLNGCNNGYLVNDTCVLEVEVRKVLYSYGSKLEKEKLEEEKKKKDTEDRLMKEKEDKLQTEAEEHKRREEEKKRKEEEERVRKEEEVREQIEAEVQEQKEKIKKRKLEKGKYIEEAVEPKASSSHESNQDKDQAKLEKEKSEEEKKKKEIEDRLMKEKEDKLQIEVEEHKRREEEKKIKEEEERVRKEEEVREQKEAEVQEQKEKIKKRELEKRKYIEEVVEQKASSSQESNQDKDQVINSPKISFVASVVLPQLLISDSVVKDIEEVEEIERKLLGMIVVFSISSLASSGISWPLVGDPSLGLGKLEELLEIKDSKEVLADPTLHSSLENVATLLLRKPEFLGQSKLSALRCFCCDLHLFHKAYNKSLEFRKKVEDKETEKKTGLDEADGFIKRLNSTKSSLKNMLVEKEKLLRESNQLELSIVEARIQLKQILEEKDRVQRTNTSLKDIEASLQEAKQEREQELEPINDRWINLKSSFKKWCFTI